MPAKGDGQQVRRQILDDLDQIIKRGCLDVQPGLSDATTNHTVPVVGGFDVKGERLAACTQQINCIRRKWHVKLENAMLAVECQNRHMMLS